MIRGRLGILRHECCNPIQSGNRNLFLTRNPYKNILSSDAPIISLVSFELISPDMSLKKQTRSLARNLHKLIFLNSCFSIGLVIDSWWYNIDLRSTTLPLQTSYAMKVRFQVFFVASRLWHKLAKLAWPVEFKSPRNRVSFISMNLDCSYAEN